MAITLASLNKRVANIAKALALCEQCMTPLACLYDSWWTGSEAEWEELEALLDRIHPSLTPILPSGQWCRRHASPEPLYCLACHPQASQPVWGITPAEVERYEDLAARFQVKPPDAAHHLLSRDEAPPPSMPGYFRPASMPAPAPMPRREPSPAPLVRVDDEEDDPDVSDELVALVEQLRQRVQP